MITIDNLTKRYGHTTVVDDVSFVAGAGRVTGFLGPNGAGKSTTMRMVVGLTQAHVRYGAASRVVASPTCPTPVSRSA